MERLKAAVNVKQELRKMKFTFQYGEIKSPSALPGTAMRSRFTFQYGEIKSVLS